MLEFQWSKNYKESERLFVYRVDSVSAKLRNKSELKVKIIPYKNYTGDGPVWSLAYAVATQSMYWRMQTLEKVTAVHFTHTLSKIERNRSIHHIAILRAVGLTDL